MRRYRQRWSAPQAWPFCIVQQALADKGAPDGRSRGVVADVISQKQDNFAEQQRVGNGPLFFPFAALQNVPHDHSGINAIQQHIGALLIQLRLGQRRHTAKLCVGFKQVAQLIRFAVFSLGALFHSAVGRFVLNQQIAWKSKNSRNDSGSILIST